MLKNILTVSKFALPISISALINMVASFAAMYMVAKLGEQELAAGSLAVSTFITLTMVMPIFYAIGILISHNIGEEKPFCVIGDIVRNGLWIAMVFATAISLILWHADKILLIFGENPNLVKLTQVYFHFGALTIFPMLIISVITQFYTGIGRPQFNMQVALSSLPVTIFLSYCFILGKLGLPQLGLAGITCSMFIVQSVAAVIFIFILARKKALKKFQIFNKISLPNILLCKKIISLGMPIGIQFGGELAAMTISTYFMGYFGVAALAAGQIVSQYSLLVVMCSLGLSQALTILTSEAYGRKNPELIKGYLRASIVILTLFFGVIFLIFLSIPHYLINVFINHNNENDRNAVTHFAIIFITLAGFTLFFDGIRNLLSGGLRGVQDSKAPMRIGLFCLWIISLPMSYFIAFQCGGGPVGLRIGFMSGFIIAVFLLWMRVKRKTKMLIQV